MHFVCLEQGFIFNLAGSALLSDCYGMSKADCCCVNVKSNICCNTLHMIYVASCFLSVLIVFVSVCLCECSLVFYVERTCSEVTLLCIVLVVLVLDSALV